MLVKNLLLMLPLLTALLWTLVALVSCLLRRWYY